MRLPFGKELGENPVWKEIAKSNGHIVIKPIKKSGESQDTVTPHEIVDET